MPSLWGKGQVCAPAGRVCVCVCVCVCVSVHLTRTVRAPATAGQCLSAENLKELIEFAVKERIVLMADEVYQVRSRTIGGACS